MNIRCAEPRDVPGIHVLSVAIQISLTSSGSLQILGPIPTETIAKHVSDRAVLVLEVAGQLQGAVFASAETALSKPALADWGLAVGNGAIRYVHKLMVDPGARGHGHGHALLDAAWALARRSQSAFMVLDCWAGSDKLRAFYQAWGMELLGEFPEHDYYVAVFVKRA